MDVKDIRELKEHYVKDLYNSVRAEQRTDQTYRDDTFVVPQVQAPHKIFRSGLGARMVDAPAEQIVTSNPQAFVECTRKDTAEHISAELNSWLDYLRHQNPNPFKETIKNMLGRGETYIQTLHNQEWIGNPPNRNGIPIKFVVPDPMVVYGSPEEDDRGIPKTVIVFYQRQLHELIANYATWTNPKNGGRNKRSEWMEYWSSDERYFEADEEGVLGPQQNVYRFPPFVRRYSGFGRRSPDGKLEDMIVSDLRFCRDLILEECILRSDISSTFHLFAHKPMNLLIPDSAGEVDPKKIADSISLGSYDLNVIRLPEGSQWKEAFENLSPDEQMINYLFSIRAEINQRNPLIMAGNPFGASGRQQDMSAMSGMKRYDTVIENAETAWATALEMGLRICSQIPTLRPDGIRAEDLDRDYKITVRLRADDPAEKDRLSTLGDRLWNGGNGAIDLRTNLIEYQGKSQDEAEQIIANILVDNLTLFNPDVAAVMGMMFAEESGMSQFIEQAQQEAAMKQQQGKALQETPNASAQQRTQGEVRTGIGREMMDMALSSKGARRPPARYTQQ